MILVGNCVELMRGLEPASVDAIVTDPPYELGFMGKAWDASGVTYKPPTWAEALRVLKPGGHLLAFGGTRTYHRLACAIEDAGFEIRDCLSWLYGSGFPKSHNLNGDWQGWGTALKPAHEPIVVARKPLAGTVAGNVLEHGTGALNVDGCRVGDGEGRANGGPRPTRVATGGFNMSDSGERPTDGRWPANVVLDEEAAAMLDEQTGERPGFSSQNDHGSQMGYGDSLVYGNGKGVYQGRREGYNDSGGVSRFFYVAKASRAERNAGLEGFEEGPAPGSKRSAPAEGRTSALGRPRANHHPTVKPVALMRWLVRLVTPTGGTVLDPFAGSGTTGIAAALEGFRFIGMEQDAGYAEIAEARIAFWTEHGEEGLRIVAERERAEAEREAVVASGQLELL